MAYFMHEMNVSEMQEALKKTSTVILPVGVVEQHGFHLPLSTDIYTATEVPKLAGDRLDAVVAPTVPYCYSGGELAGTINVSPQVFSLLIMDISSEFVRLGFKNIIVFLGHGGTDNRAALESCLKMVYKRINGIKDITLSIIDCWALSPTWEYYYKMEPEHDFHAGLVETSLMMYWGSHLVKDKIVMDTPEVSQLMRTDCDWFETAEKPFDSNFIVPKIRQREEIKVGVMGFPERSTRELGEVIGKEMAIGLVNYVNKLNNR